MEIDFERSQAELKSQKKTTLIEKIFLKVDATGICWEWTGSKALGYGMFSRRIDGKIVTYRAHRYIYKLLVGEIPDGMVLDHLCRNRACVNPDHLDIVTDRENNLRGGSPVANNARKTHCPRGHEYDSENTVKKYGYRYCKICSKMKPEEEEK